MTLDDARGGIRRITDAVDVPITADVQSGHDPPGSELVERVLEAGAVGINVEDTVHGQGRLRGCRSMTTTSAPCAPQPTRRAWNW